jgi:hypothetical protein
MKNYKNHIVLFILITSVLNTNAANVKSKYESINTFVFIIHPNVQQEDPVLFLTSFLKWYKTKFDYLDHHIFPVNMDFKNHAPYRINYKETEKYLFALKSSGFFSDDYISHYRNYFKKIDLTLQKTKQDDGPVDGLDYDPILRSQEPESILENLNSIRLAVVKFTEGEVMVKMLITRTVDNYFLYHLKKIGGKYLIDKIDFVDEGKIEN